MSFAPLPTYDYFTPSFKLFDATGETLIWQFYAVDDTNIPQEPVDTVIMTNFRSSGAVVINGGNKPFQGSIHFWLIGSGYTEVIAQIQDLVTAIPVNVPFILEVGTGIDSVPITYNVKRTQDFEWPNVNVSLRNYYSEVRLNLLCNAW